MEKPYLVDWSITNKCNLKCIYCGFKLEKEPVSRTTAIRIVREIAELNPNWLLVEGGEALLREDFGLILEALSEYDLEVNVLTNGMRLDEKNIALLRKFNAKTMISFDGGKKQTYESIRRGASFEKAVAAIENSLKAGILEAVDFTVLKTNYHEIPIFLKLMSDLAVPKINFIPLKPPSPDYEGLALSPTEYVTAIKSVCDFNGTCEIYFDEPFFQLVVKELGKDVAQKNRSRIYAPAGGCIFGKYLFIRYDGSVRPCMFSQMEVGDVYSKRLLQIWQELCNSDFIRKMHKPFRTGFCEQCKYLEVCKGCAVRAVHFTNNWFESDPACPIGNRVV